MNLKASLRGKIKIIFMGTPEFAVPIFESLAQSANFDIAAVVTEPDKPAHRKMALTPTPIKIAALKYHLPIIQPEKPEKALLSVKKIKPDIIVVVAYGKIIPLKFLEIPRFGAVNIHPSKLPEFRGPSPIQAALLKGLSQITTTIMLLDKKMDQGPILKQIEVKIEANDNFQTLSKKLSLISAKIIENTILQYIQGKIKPKKQKNSKASYCKKITKNDGLLDFTQPAEKLENQIRAYAFWPKTYTFWGNFRLIILEAKAIKNRPEPPAAAGAVYLDKNSRKIAILTGKGSLLVKSLQLEGKKPLNSPQFLNGYPNIIGEILKNHST